ncbi:heparinase II/III domain-containing protein [Paenibacillus eucommiae]|uniref:Heparinase II/III-like C-terminal domain-containing protein n=1 Tax=Paenibacillus eucommiae TaxID=1355755 RepID=A0ABS4IV44_9BACL|nr:heparinase II/III family protein [Paenibacillus eucommiae]MBP1991461.1 hypothetical protein [Paenibacillus eucommiae]
MNGVKTLSAFYPDNLLLAIKRNAESHEWAAAEVGHIEEAAAYWSQLSDEELWQLMFGSTISRSWFVWSDGCCPSCRQDVPLFQWGMNAFEHPWKTQCPHCRELFPKNDFHRYYRSGLDQEGIFQQKLADRRLLHHEAYPDPSHPLHLFGVDDGEGYVDAETGHRWRFIGAYLIFGQWKQLIVNGIVKLADAYVASGNVVYARKAGILLDRVADLYPTFDFGEQGVMYEGPARSGYVSTWHDACMETKEIALAYDKVVEGMRQDEQLVVFLRSKALLSGLANGKQSAALIQSNIEERILRDALVSLDKIYCNYPQTEITVAIIRTILDWSESWESRESITAAVYAMLKQATAVDGVTGEKGLANYTPYTINALAEMLALYDRLDADFLEHTLTAIPQLKQTFRFFMDTLCLEQQYYPQVGDSGEFAKPAGSYKGVQMLAEFRVQPSMYRFLWKLYQITGDKAYAKILYLENGRSIAKLPYDLGASDFAEIQQEILHIVEEEGEGLLIGSMNKQQWHLAILRSGTGSHSRALWVAYDSLGNHGHYNGMTIGLFAHGLDLLPDFGYPPLHFGQGWVNPKVLWYYMTASHNTVVVDGKNHEPTTSGSTTMWLESDGCQLIRVSGPEIIGGQQFERTLALMDISEEHSYVLDIFRVTGGKDHAKFVYAHPGELTTRGLSVLPAPDYGHGSLLRNFQADTAAKPGWSADWLVEDMHRVRGDAPRVHLKHTELTYGAEAHLAEAWMNAGGQQVKQERWIPSLMVRRQIQDSGAVADAANTADVTGAASATDAPLSSTFVSIIEPYEGTSQIVNIRRLTLFDGQGKEFDDREVAVEIQLAAGQTDLIISLDSENPLGSRSGRSGSVFVREDWDVEFTGEFCHIRRTKAGIERVVLGNATSLRVDGHDIRLQTQTECVELISVEGKLQVI